VGTCSQIWNLVPRSRFLLFLPRKKYKIFCNKILHTGRIKHRIHSRICFEFFQSSKFNFFEVWKNKLHWARPPNWRSRQHMTFFHMFLFDLPVCVYSSPPRSSHCLCIYFFYVNCSLVKNYISRLRKRWEPKSLKYTAASWKPGNTKKKSPTSPWRHILVEENTSERIKISDLLCINRLKNF
jgi:hypothetical protein